MRRAVGLLAIVLWGCSAPPPPPAARTKVVDLGPLHIDRIYKSMDGPHERRPIDVSGIDWIVGFRTHVHDAGSNEKLGDEFFCHSQVQLDNATRLLVTATGIDEVRFPEGFGMPLRRILGGVPDAWRGVSVLGMVLNNHDPGMDRVTTVRASIDYLSDAEARARGLKTLFKVEVPMTVESVDVPQTDPSAEHCVLVGGLKSHWMVPPGRQVTRKRYKDLFPVDSTVHFGAVHLHNHGVYLRFTDVTTGEVLWQTDVVYEEGRRQIAKIPFYASATGFPVYRDHEYEIEALYENIDAEPTDAMAVAYLYYHPKIDVDITYPHPPPPGAVSDTSL